MPRSEDSTGACDSVRSGMLDNSEELNMMYDDYESELDFGFMPPAVNVGDKERVASIAGGMKPKSISLS